MQSTWGPLAGVVLGAFLVMVKDWMQHRRDRSRARYEYLRALYADWIASRDKYIVCVHHPDSHPTLADELPGLQAKFMISAPDEIFKKCLNVQSLINNWGNECDKIRDGLGNASLDDIQIAYAKLMEESDEMVKMMKYHLKSIDV